MIYSKRPTIESVTNFSKVILCSMGSFKISDNVFLQASHIPDFLFSQILVSQCIQIAGACLSSKKSKYLGVEFAFQAIRKIFFIKKTDRIIYLPISDLKSTQKWINYNTLYHYI